MITNLLPFLSYFTLFLAIVLLFLWSSYNKLIIKRNQVHTDFSDVSIQVKRKADLADRLADLTKDYAKHEEDTYREVAAARSAVNSSQGAADTAKAENQLSQTLRSLMMVVESNPKIKANENYLALRDDLKNIEALIADHREEYNLTVQDYNNLVQTFPRLLAAKLFGFSAEEFFNLTA